MKLHFSVITLLLTVSSIAQVPFITINGNNITYEQFKQENANNIKWIGAEKTIESYINYTLLQQYAVENNIEDNPMYQKNYNLALKALKDSLFLPTTITEPIYRNAFEQFKNEKKIIAFHFNNEAKAKQVRQFILKNKTATLDEIKTKFQLKTEEVNTQYILPFYLNDTIESKVYALKVNEITNIFPYRKNFHFIKLESERPYLGELKLGMITVPKTEENKALIESIYKQLQEKSKPFQELAKEYSKNDLADEYGTMQTINFGLPEDIYNQVTQLKKDEFSKPFEFENCYNILKLYHIIPMENYESSKLRIAHFFSGTQKRMQLEDAHIKNVLKNSPYIKEDQTLRNTITDALLDETQQNKEIFSIYGDAFTVKQLKDSLTKLNPDLSQFKKNPKAVLFYIDNLKEEKSLYFYHSNAFFWQEHTQPIVNQLKKSYRTIYAIEKIQSDALLDEKGMQEYLTQNQSKYVWKNRAEGNLYYCLDEQVANEVLTMLKKKKSHQTIIDSYKDKTNNKNQVLLFAITGKFTSNNKDFPSQAHFVEGIQKVPYNSYIVVADIHKILPEQPMEFSEIRNKIAPMYQEIYTQRKIKELHAKASVQINEEQKQKLIQEFGK